MQTPRPEVTPMDADAGPVYDDPGEDDQARRREREVALQRLIDDLTERLHGVPEADVVPEMDAVLARGGFTDMPERWREAVAGAITNGTAYVVSVDAAEERERRLDHDSADDESAHDESADRDPADPDTSGGRR